MEVGNDPRTTVFEMEDLFTSILRYTEPIDLLQVVPLVCKNWSTAPLEPLWYDFCFECIPSRLMGKKKSDTSWKEWFFISTAMAYDPALQWNRMFTSPEDAPPEEPDLRYITEESALLPFTVLKNSGSPDTNVALVKRKVHAGQKAFCEFLIEKKGDEFLVGITNNGSTIRSLSGWTLIRHASTWAYWDRRVGLQFGGNLVAVHSDFLYGTGDRIGILLDMEEGQVTFYKNDQEVGRGPVPLEVEEAENEAKEVDGDRRRPGQTQPVYQFFVMLDLGDDLCVINNYY